MLNNLTDQNFFFISGPCSLESKQQIFKVAKSLDKLNLTYLRTPLFKPRTRPESFQGLGADALPILKELKLTYPKLKFVGEVCSQQHLEMACETLDILQIGSRNMQNFELLKSIGEKFKCQKNTLFTKVILKRGFAANLEEWTSAADYLIAHGIPKENILLCERGIRAHAGTHHVILDFATALKAQELGFKVIIDPSHGTKEASLVLPLAKASLALKFDGLMIEAHPEPKKSVSDAAQALSLLDLEEFAIANK
jgi:3-deoxy-7-phosphoheptulonate synthase